MALHQAKLRGRNTTCEFIPEMQEKAEAKYRLVEGMRRAVANDELLLHFQPQVDIGGNVLGAEALLRWNSPQGEIGPAVFIPVAEETGLIHALGKWSLRKGCERLAAWRREAGGFHGNLSVNVSPWQLARPDFVDELRRILDETRVDPSWLTLEITESAVLYDVKETVAKLAEIRPLGVKISLDDFGTGYSSLALIKDLPLDAIKIDQSFVRRLSEGANQHLVRVVVAIGDELGLAVVAEGVETESELQLLAQLGCRVFQGYHYCRPVPEAQFLSWLAARAAAASVAPAVTVG
jgi:EAL domain-containing protein (putative c-di-GMP-specific phosphodiesterase class I)